MRRLLTSALGIALLCGVAGNAAAQEDMAGRRASAFDVGIFAGGAWTSSWFSTGDQDWTVGLAPIFGANATYWLSPTLGLRLNGKYMPSQLPEDDDFFGNGNDNYAQNNWFYDLDLMWRPLWSGGGMLESMYVFAGGGGLTTDILGSRPDPGCVPVAPWIASGVCLSDDPSYSSVGQGVLGVGIDAFRFTPTLGLYLEAAVHGYDSPAHVSETTATVNGEDKFAVTPELALGLKFGFGNLLPPPPPPPPPPAPLPPPPPPVVETQTIQVCVIGNDGMLTNVSAEYNTARGDTTVNGQPFATAYPAGPMYAGGATWYINNEPVTFGNRRYVKYGLPRVLGTTEVTRAGDYQGVGVFTETGAAAARDVLYIPIRPGCEFQPYQQEAKTGTVRG